MGVNKIIGRVNETIGQLDKAIQYKELKITTTTYADKFKQTSSAYDIKSKEKTPNTSENKEKARDSYA